MDNEKFDRDSLPELEPLMPGEDLPDTRPPDHEEYMDYDMRTKELFMGESVRQKAERARNKLRLKEMFALVCLFVVLYLFVLSWEHLSWKIVMLTLLLPVPYGVLMRMVSNKMDLQEALRNCKPYFFMTVLNLIADIVVFFLIRW